MSASVEVATVTYERFTGGDSDWGDVGMLFEARRIPITFSGGGFRGVSVKCVGEVLFGCTIRL